MTKRKRRLSRQSKMKEKRVENQNSVGNQINRKKSLGALRPHQKTNPVHPMRRVSFTFNATRWWKLLDN